MLDTNPLSRITAQQIMEHPYFNGIDFTTLSSQIPPFVPPYEPLPVIRDNPLENELVNLRYSIDETYRVQERLKREAIERVLGEGERCRYASIVVHVHQSEERTRQLVLTSKNRLVIMDNPITSIKAVIVPTQISDVVVTSKGFLIKVDRPKKIKFRFLTPEMNEAVWYNCIQWIMRQAREKRRVVNSQL
ncbi:uncharacterized protein [Blastocystis hominis]|uniref:Protein kinase domain-containing protein n=1 Tax=Blastocystis hominis TaxID=12968 RepID=D8M3A3_BLAHO|nr:uncharacterized protein [Blastocystis hominis]CBK22376.2 unnamed protein product [Blastocystis hominis]|eukprot:XP_012896424.1 uncharacterized protein [Blastocystis hominis]